jgi:hypothetical protein
MDDAKKTKKILAHLAADGGWCREDEMPRASFDFIQNMFFQGLVDGGGRQDARGTGNFKYSRLWKIKPAGLESLSKMEGQHG